MPENERILIVEDEMLVAQILQANLSKMGFTVLDIVTSGEEAIEKGLSCRPDLILMDIQLQGEIDGVEAARQLKSEINTAIVYLTAYSDQATLDRAKVTDPHGYLIKPFRSSELKTTIEMALNKLANEKKHQEQHLKAMSDKDAIAMDMMNRVYSEKLRMAFYFQTNVDQLVVPMLRTIKERAGDEVSSDVSLVQKRLANIVSPFMSQLAESFSDLTRRETEICQFIKEGLTTKEISSTLNTSTETVRHQRKSIRKKLGISNDEVNLRSYLNTI